LDFRLFQLIATVIDACSPQPRRRPGHPPTDTIRTVATLRLFLREGTPWRSLAATEDQASGSTLRRCLARWAETGLLPKVHALLVGMLRGHPDLILDTCSVRAKRGGDLTGPNPTDRAKRGIKYHIAVDGNGVPVACATTGANVNDTLLFERLFLAAFAVMARIRTVFADRGYDAEHHRIGAWPAALAGRAEQCVGIGEQALGAALRPARLYHPVAAPGRLHIPGWGGGSHVNSENRLLARLV
jgi:transposase